MSPKRSSPRAGPSTTYAEAEEELRREGRSTRTQGDGAANVQLDQNQVEELLCQALETEIGGVKVYETALRCAQNDELKGEWEKYLEETRNHEQILRDVFATMDLDTDKDTTGRRVVRSNGEALVNAMETALKGDEPALAQIVAAECVVLAETKDHLNWQLIGEVAKHVEGDGRQALQNAYEEIEDQEDEHLYHTRGWARELWMESFGLPAVMPPPEEKEDVRTEVQAARAKKARGGMSKKAGGTKGGTKGRSRSAKGRGRGRSATRRTR